MGKKNKRAVVKVPHPYQIEAMEKALGQNVILCLPTGSGKTFIAIMVIKQYSDVLNKSYSRGGKRAFFLVPTKVLVKQQAESIQSNTSFTVGSFSGESKDGNVIIDHWTKEYWDIVFERYQVLVLTRKIFLDLLNSGFIAHSSIATIIFDEAHRGAPNAKGKLTGDDYVNIMKTLKEKGHSSIRIVGLTASLINNRWVCDDKIGQMISVIEGVYDAEVFFPECLRNFKGREIVWCYKKSEAKDNVSQSIPEALIKLAFQIPVIKGSSAGSGDDLDYVPLSFLLQNGAIPVNPSQIKKTFEGLARIFSEFGPWSLNQSLIFIVKSFNSVCQQITHLKSSFIQVIELVLKTLQDFQLLVQNKLETYGKGYALLAGIPDKMLRLLQCLYEFNEKAKISGDAVSAIIFVERRLDAFALSKWLDSVSRSIQEYNFIKCDFTVGSASFTPFPFHKLLQERPQERVIKEFKDQKLNILVATSVLEEGLDITHCNLIIRYDYTPTFRAYVQSKGRARSKEACFVFFASENEHTVTEQDIEKFRLTEDRLHEYQRPLYAVELARIDNGVYLKTSEGATLPYNECKNRVLFYCDHLPGDYFMSKIPKTKIEEISCHPSEVAKLFRCHLNLPKISRLHSLTISGRKCPTESEAEMDAYYETVKILWAHGELNDAFRPLDKKTLINNLLDQYKLGVNKTELKEWEEKCSAIRKAWNADKKNKRNGSPDFPPKPGTSKSRRLYPQMYSKALIGYQSLNSSYWLYKVTLTTESSCFGTLGMMTYNLLPLNELQDQLSIFSTKDELKVSIELVRPITVTEDVLKDIRNFQDYIYTGCLKIGLNNERQNSKIYFTSSTSSYHLLFIFLTNENTIDFEILKQQYQRRPIIPEDYSKLKGALISKNYGDNNRSLWLVAEVDHNMSPASKFPAPCFDTYADYYRSTYGVTTIDSNQPLLACYPAPTKTYFPWKLVKVFKKSRKTDLLVHLIPGICQFEYFSGECVQMVYTIPAITTAINNLLMAGEIRKRFCTEIGYGLSETPDNLKLIWDRKRCTNFVPLNAKITEVPAGVSEPVDLSFVICKRYVNPPAPTRTASTLSLDVLPGTSENDLTYASGDENENEEEDDSDSDSDSDNDDSLVALGSDGNAAQSMSKPFNPEVLNSSNSNQTSRPAVEIFHTGKTTLFSEKPAPTIVPIPWDDEDMDFASDFEKLRASFNADNASYIQDQEDDEIEAIVNNAIEVNDFSKENAIIISTDTIYADHLKTPKYGLPPELIMEAMTTKKSNSFRNLERLEIIGDSFLKYFVSACLFLKLHDLDEARITYLKMHMISNFNLLHLARSKEIAERIIDKSFFPRQNWLPPFYASFEQDFTHQEMSDKTVADMVEAMIGAHLTFLGENVAIEFLQWLGMPLFNGDDKIRVHPSSNNRYLPLYDDVLPLENPEEIMKIWECSNLPKLEEKLKYTFKRKDLLIEALTHPSWCKSQLNSYQRLEFLGDAILDYLVTLYVYDHPNYPHLTPGDVTYIRQAMVNNDYFATIAMVNDFHKYLFHFSSDLYSAIQDFRLQLINNDIFGGNTLKMGSFLLDNLSSLDNDLLAEAPKALGDIFESIAGAIYLDSGNSLATVWCVYSKFIGNELDFFCANVPKSPFVLLFESYPNTKFIKEKMSDPKQNRKRYNLIVNDQWSFTVNEEELKKEDMTKRKEKMSLVLKALNEMSKIKKPLSSGL